MHRIYLDHNATAPLRPEARAAWLEAAERFPGNPSSPHRAGLRAEAALDDARQRVAAKRDGGLRVDELQDGMAQTNQRPEELIALDAALEELAKLDPLQSQVVELRFFSGLSMEETAEVMGLSARTVARYWATARLWLLRELSAAQK